SGLALGGEQSGHIIMPAYATTGDGVSSSPPTPTEPPLAPVEAVPGLAEEAAPVDPYAQPAPVGTAVPYGAPGLPEQSAVVPGVTPTPAPADPNAAAVDPYAATDPYAGAAPDYSGGAEDWSGLPDHSGWSADDGGQWTPDEAWPGEGTTAGGAPSVDSFQESCEPGADEAAPSPYDEGFGDGYDAGYQAALAEHGLDEPERQEEEYTEPEPDHGYQHQAEPQQSRDDAPAQHREPAAADPEPARPEPVAVEPHAAQPVDPKPEPVRTEPAPGDVGPLVGRPVTDGVDAGPWGPAAAGTTMARPEPDDDTAQADDPAATSWLPDADEAAAKPAKKAKAKTTTKAKAAKAVKAQG
ncbi:hypothetical protein AB0H87_23355, partial [Asanoa sp. NPDC050611]